MNRQLHAQHRLSALLALLLLVVSASTTTLAQMTAFTYQGKLTDAGNPANGNYDLQFKLFDTVTVGTGVQQGATLVRNPVAASAGVFTVQLDFGANVFSGADRYLEIGVRPAGNTGAYTVLAPRQPITSSPYAIQTLNAQQLGGLPASGFVQNSGSGTANTIPVWSNGTTLGNSGITQNGNGVQLPNGVQLGVGAQGNNVAFGSPNGETGMTIAGASGRADVRFDGSTLKLVAGGGGLVPPSTNGSAINTAGNVGIGTAAPSLINGGSGRFVSISDSTNPGLALTNTSGTQFFMYSAGSSGSFRVFDATANAVRLTLDSTGNFGIGTTAPAHRLSLIGGPPWTSNQFTGALELGNASAIGWRANAAGNRFGIGQTTGGLIFFATLNDPGTTGSPANYVMVINDNGNLTQPINNNGLVKAMLYVNENGTIARCYNGITNSSTGNCGFSTTRFAQGGYDIDFGFQVNNRFYALTMLETAGGVRRTGYIGIASANVLRIVIIDPTSSVGGPGDSNFMIIVY